MVMVSCFVVVVTKTVSLLATVSQIDTPTFTAGSLHWTLDVSTIALSLRELGVGVILVLSKRLMGFGASP